MSSIPPETSADSNVPLILSGYKLDSAVLPMSQRGRLRTFAGNVVGVIRSQNGATVSLHIIGHTDGSGTERHNTVLGFNRAQGVRQILESFFAPEATRRTRFQLVAAGEQNPIASNATERGRAANRRVEVKAEYVIPAKPHPLRRAASQRQAPPSLPITGVCIEFEKMRQWFDPVYQKLSKMYISTSLHWAGPGSPITLTPPEHRNRVSTAIAEGIEEVPKAGLSSVEDEFPKKLFGEERGEAIAGGVDFALEYLQFAHELREDSENTEIMGHPNSPEWGQRHRKLVAARVSEGMDRGGEAPSWFAHVIEMNWMKYEELMSACNERRGLTSPSYPSYRPTPADRGTGNPLM